MYSLVVATIVIVLHLLGVGFILTLHEQPVLEMIFWWKFNICFPLKGKSCAFPILQRKIMPAIPRDLRKRFVQVGTHYTLPSPWLGATAFVCYFSQRKAHSHSYFKKKDTQGFLKWKDICQLESDNLKGCLHFEIKRHVFFFSSKLKIFRLLK